MERLGCEGCRSLKETCAHSLVDVDNQGQRVMVVVLWMPTFHLSGLSEPTKILVGSLGLVDIHRWACLALVLVP